MALTKLTKKDVLNFFTTGNSTYTVEHDSFSKYIFGEMEEKYPRLHRLQKKKADFKPLPALVFDTFNLFYQQNPEFLDDSEIHPEYLVNKEILQKAMKTEAYEQLKMITTTDELNSTVATIGFSDTLFELIDKIEKENKKIRDLAEQLEKLRLQQLQKLQQKEIENQNQNLNQIQNQEKNQDQIQKIESEIQALTEKLNKSINKCKRNIRMINIVKAMEKALNDVKDVIENLSYFGYGTSSGEPTFVDPEERIKLAKELTNNRKLMEIAKELGRIKRIFASVKKEKIKQPVSEIYDITLSDNISRVTSSEVLKLVSEELELIFYKDFLEKKLATYNLKDTDKLGKADFCICLDLSGSMSGSKEIWAKALCLALMQMALKENRNFVVIPFSNDALPPIRFNNKIKTDDILKLASIFIGGGTNFEKPLRKAIEEMQNLERADIVFITDGECSISQQFLNEFLYAKNKHGFRVLSLYIGNIINTLQLFSDKVVAIQDIVAGTWDVAKALGG
jgi:uncharacterized protein with von Willebrand factor type A (vWA) domain